MSEQRRRPIGWQTGTETRSDEGMRILSYLLAGLLFYGGLGYLADRWLGTGWLLPVGLILGVGISIFLVIKRYGSVE